MERERHDMEHERHDMERASQGVHTVCLTAARRAVRRRRSGKAPRPLPANVAVPKVGAPAAECRLRYLDVTGSALRHGYGSQWASDASRANLLAISISLDDRSMVMLSVDCRQSDIMVLFFG